MLSFAQFAGDQFQTRAGDGTILFFLIRAGIQLLRLQQYRAPSTADLGITFENYVSDDQQVLRRRFTTWCTPWHAFPPPALCFLQRKILNASYKMPFLKERNPSNQGCGSSAPGKKQPAFGMALNRG